MHDKLQRAIANNNGLYEAVFANRGIGFRKTEMLWYSQEKAPRLYSNLVTLSPDWQPDGILDAIERSSEEQGWQEWSVKDSFAVLNLAEHGFARLFDARWLYLEADAFTPVGDEAPVRYAVVADVNGLAAWRAAWDPDIGLGEEIFGPELLRRPDVCFVAGYEADRLTSGCFVNRTGSVLGISNYFAPGTDAAASWSGLVRFIFRSIGRADIVGYERPDLASELRAPGFEPVGDLAVWLKRRVP